MPIFLLHQFQQDKIFLRKVFTEWIFCVRKYVMNKTEMGPVLIVLTSIPLVLKCKAIAHLPPALFALRTTLTHSGHNIQLTNVDLVRNSRKQSLQDFRGLVNYGINGSQTALPSKSESPGTHLYIPGISHLVTSLRNTTGGQRK